MVFVIAAYHDLARDIDDANHEKLSAELYINDPKITKLFTNEENKMISEAIEDHRASSTRKPRSIYGELISSADKIIDIKEPLIRTYKWVTTRFPERSLEECIKESHTHLCKKFGIKDGYAIDIAFDDGKYSQFLKDLNELLSDYLQFHKKYLEINDIKQSKKIKKSIN